MAGDYTVVTASYVNVQVSSSLTSFGAEKRFQKDITIGELKGKLELITGCVSTLMDLELYNAEGKFLGPLDNDAALLGSYPVEDGMRIHVINKDGNRVLGEFEDVSKVEKFEISKEAYEKRADSVRAFKMKHKMGQFKEVSPEEQAILDKEKAEKAKEEERLVSAITIDSRCEVSVPNAPPTKRGTVKYVGKTEFKPGYWVGVQYDEPLGKNDGSVQGKRYFTCPDKYGGFVKPQYVTVGDFPEEDLGLDEM
ncbi:tubulin-folding cofactor B-like [Diadema antillarum]|uniref:tubulin-folding cofactor B-like n=1 Tax=Diadema antillarum TaxID=105358 RepID=UPI003A867628